MVYIERCIDYRVHNSRQVQNRHPHIRERHQPSIQSPHQVQALSLDDKNCSLTHIEID